MICTVLYNVDDSKALKSKGFANIETAKKYIDENGGQKSNYIQNARIVIDYSAVEAYREMYELMRDKVFGSKTETNEKKVMI